MTSIGRRAAIGSVLLILTIAAGCSAGVPFEADISAAPSQVLELSWGQAKRTNRGIEVWGQVQQVHCCRYLRGHIHFDAKAPDGSKLASTDALWGEFNPRQLHSAWFRAVLPVPAGARISRIEIQFDAEAPNRVTHSPPRERLRWR